MSTRMAPPPAIQQSCAYAGGAAQLGFVDGALLDVMWSMSWRACSGSFNRMVP